MTPRQAVRDGITDVAPMLVGIIPFGLVAGAAPVAAGLDVAHAVGMSALMFAGASQLAVADVLGSAGAAPVAVVTALIINLRMVLYSASLAPALAGETLGRRLQMGYFLVDQAYALSVIRWDGTDDRRLRVPYYLAIAVLLWIVWQVTTIVGALVGARLPAEIPLDFAVPLVFLVLLVPVLDRRPSLVAAAVGGFAAVASAELGAGRLAIVVGAVCGIAAGALLDRPDTTVPEVPA
jgi:4-azaleucine resistance transporter AzlC